MRNAAIWVGAVMSSRFLLLITPLLVTISAPPSNAQSLPDHLWNHGTTVDVLIGGSVAPSTEARTTLGGALGWELNRWFTVQGSGAWFVGTEQPEAFSATLSLLTNLQRPRRVVPFAGAGFGLYRATFKNDAPVPAFYQRRLDVSSRARTTFTDPSFAFEAGLNIFTSRHFSVRPAVAVRLVTRNSSAYAVTTAGAHVTYHFEVHDVPQ